jgi:hypothetical protein
MIARLMSRLLCLLNCHEDILGWKDKLPVSLCIHCHRQTKGWFA